METWKIKSTSASAAVDFETILGIPILNAIGVGMPSVENIITAFGVSDGGYYQRQRVKPREFVLICGTPAQDELELYTIRSALISYINRDRSTTEQPCVVQYVKNSVTLEIDCYYDSGLEFGERKKYVERIPLRFVAPNPFWRNATQSSVNLGFELTIPTAYDQVIANNGDANAWPIITVTGPGKVLQIKNSTTGKVFDLDVDLAGGEVATFDMRPGIKTITSNISGSLIGYLTIPSDFARFCLVPGNNTISTAIDNAGASATFAHYDTYWSVDGVA